MEKLNYKRVQRRGNLGAHYVGSDSLSGHCRARGDFCRRWQEDLRCQTLCSPNPLLSSARRYEKKEMFTRDKELDCAPFVGCAGQLSKTSSLAGWLPQGRFLRGDQAQAGDETTARWGSCALDGNREERGVGTALDVDCGWGGGAWLVFLRRKPAMADCWKHHMIQCLHGNTYESPVCPAPKSDKYLRHFFMIICVLRCLHSEHTRILACDGWIQHCSTLFG